MSEPTALRFVIKCSVWDGTVWPTIKTLNIFGDGQPTTLRGESSPALIGDLKKGAGERWSTYYQRMDNRLCRRRIMQKFACYSKTTKQKNSIHNPTHRNKQNIYSESDSGHRRRKQACRSFCIDNKERTLRGRTSPTERCCQTYGYKAGIPSSKTQSEYSTSPTTVFQPCSFQEQGMACSVCRSQDLESYSGDSVRHEVVADFCYPRGNRRV